MPRRMGYAQDIGYNKPIESELDLPDRKQVRIPCLSSMLHPVDALLLCSKL